MQCHPSSSPVGTDALVCPPLIIHSVVLPTITLSLSSFYPTSFEIDETPSSIPRNALFALTKRLLCYHETPSLLSRNALFALKMCPLCYHGTPSLLSRCALFTITKHLSYTDLILSFNLPFLHLPAILCLQMGTDALVWKPLPVSPKGRSN